MATGSESGRPASLYQFTVIDDPNKVTIVSDRGESQYRSERPELTHPRPIRTTELNENVVLDTIGKLQDALVPCFLGHGTKFVPRDKFDKIITPEVVFQIICKMRMFEGMHREEKPKIAQSIYYGDGALGPRRKLLCLVLLSYNFPGEPDEQLFATAMGTGMSDNCLPLSYVEGDDDGLDSALHCKLHGKAHENLWSTRERQARDYFHLWSQRLNPAYITWEPGAKHRHYVLEEGDPLPMTIVSHEEPRRGFFQQAVRVRMDASGGAFTNHTVTTIGAPFISSARADLI